MKNAHWFNGPIEFLTMREKPAAAAKHTAWIGT